MIVFYNRKTQYYEETKKVLHNIFNNWGKATAPLELTTAKKVIHQETNVDYVDLHNIAQKLKCEEPSLPASVEIENNTFNEMPSIYTGDNNGKLSDKLNSTQKTVYNQIQHHFQKSL